MVLFRCIEILVHQFVLVFLSVAEVTKEAIRKSVWNYLEDNDLVQFPRPVHHRIPNFVVSIFMLNLMQNSDNLLYDCIN